MKYKLSSDLVWFLVKEDSFRGEGKISPLFNLIRLTIWKI